VCRAARCSQDRGGKVTLRAASTTACAEIPLEHRQAELAAQAQVLDPGLNTAFMGTGLRAQFCAKGHP
jgi:hypothetical protein